MSEPIRLRWEGDQRYVGTDSYGREVAVDGDLTTIAGSKPSDLMPISLAACVAYTLVEVLAKRRQRLDSLEADIFVENEPDPPWMFTRIEVRFTARGDVDLRKAQRSLALAHEKYCSVSASLRPEVELVYSIEVAGD